MLILLIMILGHVLSAVHGFAGRGRLTGKVTSSDPQSLTNGGKNSSKDENDDSTASLVVWDVFGIAVGSLALFWILFWGCVLIYVYVGCGCLRRRKFTTVSHHSNRAQERQNFISFTEITSQNTDPESSPPPYEIVSNDEPYEGGFSTGPITAVIRRQQSMILPTYNDAVLSVNLETHV